ncbi:MAG TPA: hypothetical protein VJ902_03025 [Wenzhouxiangellaceae bacterium]|nr:hypothetical protein [Wenzhouxiangellaceae bacterium]
MQNSERLVDALLERHGRTFTQTLGIEVAENTPAPLFQTLCLALLFSARIRASIAVDAMRALLDAGWTTADHMARANWQARVSVLNDAGYARFDEKTSTMLGDASNLLIERYGGDLRRLRNQSDRKPAEERRLLKEIDGIGDVGVDIFFRDVQAAWPELRPFVDKKAMDGARRIGLPTGAAELSEFVDERDFPRLVTALVRMELAGDSDEVVAAA